MSEIIRILIESGCRQAEPGEFTRRAFVNGRMDLSQAEAVADLIAASGRASHDMALGQLRGNISSELSALRDKLLKMTSLMELELDFSDHEELEFADRSKLLQLATVIQHRISSLASSFRTGQAIKQGIPVAIIGKTNVGKSTIMNLLAKSDVFAENKLFATLDTTVRKVVIDNVPFLLSDTVGFIRKLPTQLVEAFKSTLDEVREADILLHVVDISHPGFEEQMEVVENTLRDIGASNKPIFVIFNKIDAYEYEEYDEFSLEPKTAENYSLEELKNSWIAQDKTPCIFISAKKRINIDKLRNDIYKMVAEIHAGRYPFNNFLW